MSSNSSATVGARSQLPAAGAVAEALLDIGLMEQVVQHVEGLDVLGDIRIGGHEQQRDHLMMRDRVGLTEGRVESLLDLLKMRPQLTEQLGILTTQGR